MGQSYIFNRLSLRRVGSPGDKGPELRAENKSGPEKLKF